MNVEESNDPRSSEIVDNQIQLTELVTYEERAPDFFLLFFFIIIIWI